MLRLSTNKTWTVAIGGVAAVASAVALGAGSLAYFSDTQSAPLATVSNGTLTLSINSGSTVIPVTITGAQPGLIQPSTPLVFSNTGTVPGALRLRVVPASTNSEEFNNDVLISFTGLTTMSSQPGGPGGPANPPITPTPTVATGLDGPPTPFGPPTPGFYVPNPTPASTVLDGPQTLAQAAAASSTGDAVNGLTIATLAPNASRTTGYSFTIDPNAGNALQGQTGSFSITADLIQTDNTPSTIAFPAPPASNGIPGTGNCSIYFYYVNSDGFYDGDANCTFTFPGAAAGTPVTLTPSNGATRTGTLDGDGRLVNFSIAGLHVNSLFIGAINSTVTASIPGRSVTTTVQYDD